MQLTVAALATVATFTGLAASGTAQPPSTANTASDNPRTRALNWIEQEGAAATELTRQAERELARAKSALAQAESARSLARQYGDTDAEKVAQGALTTANQAVLAAQDRLTTSRARTQRMSALLGQIVPGATGFATSVQGEVQVMSGGEWKSWNGSPIAFKPGDKISTGPLSRVAVTLEGGRTLVLRSNTTFSLRPQPSTDPSLPLLERAQGYLELGVLRLEKAINSKSALGSFQIRTPAAITSVRGTEFVLAVDKSGAVQITPISGEVELSAKKRPDGAMWWQDAPRRTLAQGARVETHGQELALIELPEGHKAALAPSSVIESAKAGETPVFALRQGRMHVWGSGTDSKLRFVTANTVIVPKAQEFEVEVGDGGLVRVTSISGTVHLTSVRERLDPAILKQLEGDE